jgi:hypothetical protein
VQEAVDAAAVHDGIELGPVGHEQAYTFGHHVDDHRARAGLAHAPVDVDGGAARLDRDVGADQAVTLAGGAAAAHRQPLPAGVGRQRSGEVLERVGAEQLDIVTPLLLACPLPVPAKDEAGEQAGVDGLVEQCRQCLRPCRSAGLGPAQDRQRPIAELHDEAPRLVGSGRCQVRRQGQQPAACQQQATREPAGWYR